MKIINADISELMFDITPEQTIERTLAAIRNSNYPDTNSTEFNTSDYLDAETNYAFEIWLEPSKIENSDILSTEALSKDEIKVKINFSNKYVRSELFSVIARKKIEEQTFSIVFKYDHHAKRYNKKYSTRIALDDTDKRNMVKTHAILEKERNVEFKTPSELEFIKGIIDKSKTEGPIIINDTDFSQTEKLNTMASTAKKLRFLIRTGKLCVFVRDLYDNEIPAKHIGSVVVYKLTKKAMSLINSEENELEVDLRKYGKDSHY